MVPSPHAQPSDAELSWSAGAAITGLFVLLAAIMTWPQVRVLATGAMSDQDVFFNLWRLGWVAHALATSPADLFNGNIFHPERGVLAYSDAMLVQGVIAAPLLWLGVPPVLVHNLLLLGAIVASGVGAVLLARQFTGSTSAALIAGVVFAFVPYRFDHYIHMELQWTVWAPWALWSLQRSIKMGSTRYGLLTGLFLALQMGSSIYYGVFLSLLLSAVGTVQLLTLRAREVGRRLRGLALGAAIAASLTGLYLLPYAAASGQVGIRSKSDAVTFSARPRDYRVATPDNLLYGTHLEGVRERRLFPGVLPLLLALAGLLLVGPTAAAAAYVVGLAIAFELSLGFFGHLYPFLYEHVSVFRAFRAPARAAVFCFLFLGVLAAHGAAAITSSLQRRTRAGIVAALCALMLLEYWVAPLSLVAYPNRAPSLYAFLSRLPRGAVAEFPMPNAESPPHHDPRFAYMSTFHWMPLVNGYSGFYPASYYERLKGLASFPDAGSVSVLRADGVKYVVVHADGYPIGERQRIVERLLQLGLARLGDFEDGWSIATILEIR